MQIALYKGKSLVSRIIRWVTRSEYSHAAFLFDESAERRAFELTEQGADLKRLHFWERGSVVEAWQGGVKNSPSVATLHTPGTPVDVFRFTRELNEVEERLLIQLLSVDVGRPYDYRDLLCFLTRQHGRPGNRVFCSLLVAKRCCDVGAPLFRNTEAWRVPPDWIGRTVALYRSNTFITQRAWKGNSYTESLLSAAAAAGVMMAALLLGGCVWPGIDNRHPKGELPPEGGVPVGELPPEGGVPANWMPTVWPASPAEVWLTGNGTNVLGTKLVKGTGTASNPFGGDFDWIKANLPERCRVHLYAGNYWSAADWDSPLKSGQYWSGAGMGITVIHRDRRFSLERDQSIFESYDNGITVQDITLDPNGDWSDQWQRNGLDLFGSRNTVRRVEVIHAVGIWTNATYDECFPIFLGYEGYGPPSYGNLVTECYVHDPVGDYITAIDLCGNGVVSFNRVEMPAGGEHYQCYAASFSKGALFFGNVSQGGGCGFYTDTGSEQDLTIANNSFFGCLLGVILWKAPGWDIDGLTVSGNHIWLGTNDYTAVNEWTSVGIGVWVRMNQVLRGMVIEGNDVRSASAATTAAVRIIGGTNAPVMRDNTLGGGMIESWTQ